jgi:hypothetical protein
VKDIRKETDRMGKTISVTLPFPLEKKLKEEAVITGMSRSRYICNILLKWDEKMKQSKEIPNDADLEKSPNDCLNRDDDGFCEVFDIVCHAPQDEADTCVGYPKKENK